MAALGLMHKDTILPECKAHRFPHHVSKAFQDPRIVELQMRTSIRSIQVKEATKSIPLNTDMLIRQNAARRISEILATRVRRKKQGSL